MKGSPHYRRINEKKIQHGRLSYEQIKGSLKFGSMMDKRKGMTSFDKSVSKFKTLIKSGPVFVCVVCNRYHYQKSVIFLKMYRYNVAEDFTFMVMSYDGNYYICNTCDKALRNNRMPVANKLFEKIYQRNPRVLIGLKHCLHQEEFYLKRSQQCKR